MYYISIYRYSNTDFDAEGMNEENVEIEQSLRYSILVLHIKEDSVY